MPETISETISKKQRGRPRLLDDAHLALVRYATDAHTTRHQQNVHYRLRATGLLMNDPRFAWLCDAEAMRAGRAHSFRPTILAEIGRIADEEDLKAVALRLCELKPKTKEAVAMIRRWRLGKSGEGDALQLANEIIDAVNNYITRYPEMTVEQIQSALFTASDKVSNLKKKKGRAKR